MNRREKYIISMAYPDLDVDKVTTLCVSSAWWLEIDNAGGRDRIEIRKFSVLGNHRTWTLRIGYSKKLNCLAIGSFHHYTNIMGGLDEYLVSGQH